MVLAWSEAEVAELPALMAQAVANGVTDVQAVTAAEALRLEPHLVRKGAWAAFACRGNI